MNVQLNSKHFEKFRLQSWRQYEHRHRKSFRNWKDLIVASQIDIFEKRNGLWAAEVESPQNAGCSRDFCVVKICLCGYFKMGQQSWPATSLTSAISITDTLQSAECIGFCRLVSKAVWPIQTIGKFTFRTGSYAITSGRFYTIVANTE